MSFVDLQKAEKPLEAEADVCIVGAGAAGLFLSVRLAEAGQRVVIIEAGDKLCDDAGGLGFVPVFTGADYPGATLGRAFGLGGSTSRWGGLLIPHSVHDIAAATKDTAGVWQHVVDRVEESAADVIATLGFSVGGDFHQFAGGKLGEAVKAIDAAGFATLTAQFMPLSKRNFSYLLRGLKRSAIEPRLFLNAVCNRWRIDRGSSSGVVIGEVGAVSANGRTVTVKAREVVIAAGTIESTRLLLELNATSAEVAATDALGRCLADHLSCPVGSVRPEDYTAVAARFRPRFSGPCLRTFRFVEKHPPAGWPRCFAHFIFEMENPAFVVAKEAIAALQGKRLPRLKVGQVIGAIGGLVAVGCARYFRSSLHVPSRSVVHLQLDVEQAPDPSNRITLTGERDAYGRPRACVHWQISDQDRANIRRAAQRILGAWPGRSAGIPELVPTPLEGDASKPYDAYHPVGTCRMGDDPRAVVDLDLRVKGAANLFVLSTAVLPSAGTANPTFTLLCLGAALANLLSKGGSRMADPKPLHR